MSEFQVVVKTIISYVLCQNIGLRLGLGRRSRSFSHWATMLLCMDGTEVQGFSGAEVRGFLDLCEKVYFILQYSGVVLPPQVEIFSFFVENIL